jgi:hypothetical protein
MFFESRAGGVEGPRNLQATGWSPLSVVLTVLTISRHFAKNLDISANFVSTGEI